MSRDGESCEEIKVRKNPRGVFPSGHPMRLAQRQVVVSLYSRFWAWTVVMKRFMFIGL